MKKAVLLLVLFLVAISEISFAEDTKEMSDQEILALLPRGIDLLDPKGTRNLSKLVSLGPSVHEALGEELLRMDDFDDSNAASCIIGIFELSSGDKSVALKYLNRFLELPRDDDWHPVRSQAEGLIRKFEAAQTEQSPTPKESDPPQEKAYPITKKPTEQKPAPSTPAEESSPSSTRWLVAAVVVVGLLGLLWVFLKKRK